jgi:hypothetical protein
MSQARQYRTVSREVVDRLIPEFLATGPRSVEAEAVVRGTGSFFRLNLDKVSEMAQLGSVQSLERLGYSSDQIESLVSIELYKALCEAPYETLDDDGFWRYLSLAFFWNFVRWREGGSLERGNFTKYVDCLNSREAVLPRMFIRGQLLVEGDLEEEATDLERATDFWRSHVIRVRTGASVEVTQGLVKYQIANTLKTERLRDLAKNLRRRWLNIELKSLTQAEIREHLAELDSLS